MCKDQNWYSMNSNCFCFYFKIILIFDFFLILISCFSSFSLDLAEDQKLCRNNIFFQNNITRYINFNIFCLEIPPRVQYNSNVDSFHITIPRIIFVIESFYLQQEAYELEIYFPCCSQIRLLLLIGLKFLRERNWKLLKNKKFFDKQKDFLIKTRWKFERMIKLLSAICLVFIFESLEWGQLLT